MRNSRVAALRRLRANSDSATASDARLASAHSRSTFPAAFRRGAISLSMNANPRSRCRASGHSATAAPAPDPVSGDALIRHDLEGRGVAAEQVEAALEALEPERERAARLVEQRGRSIKTARYLASRGFGSDALEWVVAREE